jgi:crotonobetainyl-CoA:carnitine CoA-transferase CaiB-like acyl-CoA transferase
MMHPRPLEGIRVVDLSQYIAGSACSQVLADFGAEVTKVEPLTGDPARSLGPSAEGSTYFRHYNTGKRSVTIDLADPADRLRLDDLLGDAQAVVMNFSPRTLRKHALDWETLHSRFPDLTVVVVTAYGYGDERTAFDSIAQAVSGFGYLNADEHGTPRISAGYPTDVFSGLYAALSTAMALLDPRRNGGTLVDVPMLDVAMSALCGPQLLAALADGVVSPGTGNRDAATAPSSIYPCLDGHAYVYAGLDKHWRVLAPLVGGPDVGIAERLAERETFDALVERWTRTRTVAEVCTAMAEMGIPAGPVHDPLTALRLAEASDRGAVVQRDDQGRAVPQFPVVFDGRRIPREAAPDLPTRIVSNGAS